MTPFEHLMAILQPFAVCGIFLLSGVVCLRRARGLAGMPIAALGFFLMAAGEPFLGLGRIHPQYVVLGNYVQGTALPLGATVVLVGLFLVGPKRG